MRLLVTGGTGFLGKPFVKRALKEGHEIVLISRQQVADKGVTAVKADLTDKDSLNSAKSQVGSIDAIVHLGALVYKKPEEDVADQMALANVVGTAYLLEVFGKDAKVIVNGSTAEIYGLPEADRPIHEDMLPRPASNYGASKLAGEYFANVFAARNNVPVVNLRFSVMYGAPDPIARAIPNFIKKAVAGEPLEIYGGEELRDYLHVEDAVESIMCALKATASGTYNVGSGKGTSVKDAAEAIVDLAKSKSTLTVLPRQKAASDIVLDIAALQKDLQYKPKHTFPSGIETQMEWERKQP
jgi:UDP-glucose 4-epimerase